MTEEKLQYLRRLNMNLEWLEQLQQRPKILTREFIQDGYLDVLAEAVNGEQLLKEFEDELRARIKKAAAKLRAEWEAA